MERMVTAKPRIGLHRWLALLVLGAVVPVLVFAGAMLWSVLDANERQRDRDLGERAHALAFTVDAEVRSWKTVLQTLAEGNELRGGRLREFDVEARAVAARHGGWAVINDATGQQHLNTLLPAGAQLPKTAAPDMVGAVFRDGKPVTDMVFGAAAQRHIISNSVPVFRDGTVVLCLSLNFGPERLTRLLEAQRLSRTWVAAVIDRQNRIVTRVPDPQQRIGKPTHEWLRNAVAGADSGMLTSTLSDGRPARIAFQRLGEAPWVLVLAVPVSELPSPRPLVTFVLVGGLLGAVAVAMAVGIARQIARPIRRLAHLAPALVHGEAGGAVVPSGIREVEQLQQALADGAEQVRASDREREQAAEALRRANEQLEVRVAERTAGLAETNAALEDANTELRQQIERRQQAEAALRQSEQRVRLKLESILSPEGELGSLELADIIDVQAVQSLMDTFYQLARIPMSILDRKGNVLVGVGWQEVCTKFHRVHPEACQHCLESDTLLAAGVPPGEYRLYKCKNNMWDVATPIMVGGQHVGNVFSGQFFFEGEPLDRALFRSQARQYGFDEEEYLAAVERVPRLSRDSLAAGMAFFMTFARMLSQLSYSNIKLARSLAERDALTASLRETGEKLAQQSRTFEAILSSVRDFVYIFDREGRFAFANTMLLNLWGLTREQAIGKTMRDLNYPKEVEGRLLQGIRRVVETGKVVTNETYYTSPTGTDGYYENILAPVLGSDGDVMMIAGSSRDVTARKRAEEQIRTLAKFPAENPHPVLRLNRDGVILYANEVSAPVLREWGCTTGHRAPDPWPATIQDTLATRSQTSVDLACGARIFAVFVVPVPEAGYVNLYASDITERKRAEEALQQAHDTLEENVRERTAALSLAVQTLQRQADQLRTLAAELTLAEQRERRRLAEVLHDGLQQILVAARLRAHMLGRSDDPGVHAGCREIVELLEDCLREARTLTGALSPPTLQKGRLLAALEWLTHWMRDKHQLAVRLSPAATLPPALPEDLTVLLYQSVRELLFNAVKYAHVDTAEVTFVQQEDSLTVSVADAGTGFDPSRLRVAGGTEGGFGLLGIRERLEMFGGHMKVESAPGQGSRFTLTVPLGPPPRTEQS